MAQDGTISPFRLCEAGRLWREGKCPKIPLAWPGWQSHTTCDKPARPRESLFDWRASLAARSGVARREEEREILTLEILGTVGKTYNNTDR